MPEKTRRPPPAVAGRDEPSERGRSRAAPPSDEREPAGAAESAPARPRRGAVARPVRRQQILDAALAEFAVHSFDRTKLDDVARRAGVAKGTLYLYFADKQALFEGLVQEKIAPVLADAGAMVPHFPGTTRDLLYALSEMMIARVLDQPAVALVRLMIAEGPRFPDLAAFYHRAVVSRGMDVIRLVAQRGLDRGEITSDAAVRFPQLVVAPALMAVVWTSLFDTLAPLDVRALLNTHRDLLLRGLGWRET